MIRKIVVGLDGSPRSERSLPWVDLLFRDSEKTLVKAVPALQSFGGFLHEAGTRLRKEAAEQYLHSTAAMLPGSDVRVFEGSPAHGLFKVGAEVGADLIVITTHGGSDPSGTTMGGTAEQVLYGSHFPLFVVPSGGTAPSPVARLRRVVVPLDGSAISELVIPMARELAEGHHVGLVLAHVLTGFEEVKYQYEDMAGHFDRIKKDLDRDLPATKVVVRKGKLPESILAIAGEHDADLIVMSAHGHGGLPRMLFGSIAAKLVRSSAIPLLIAKYDALKRMKQRSPVTVSEQ